MTMQYLLSFLLAALASAAFSAESKDPSEKRAAMKKRMIITNDYVHDWIKFPAVKGPAVFSSGDSHFEPRPGRAMVVWTLSVSSVRSQNILPELMRMQKKYEALFTDFVYVFVNDLPSDVRNFAQEWQLDGRVVLGEDEFKKAFKYRQPPTVYVADRFGWLNWVAFEVTENKLPEVEQYLEKLNVL